MYTSMKEIVISTALNFFTCVIYTPTLKSNIFNLPFSLLLYFIFTNFLIYFYGQRHKITV